VGVDGAEEEVALGGAKEVEKACPVLGGQFDLVFVLEP